MPIKVPTSPGPSARSANMRAIRRRDSGPEKALRSALHRRGLRFRVDYPIAMPTGRAPRPDVVFPRRRLAVFIDGCFWHGCPEHSQPPRKNGHYWGPKISRNIERDAEQKARLEKAGWTVVRVWEHDDPVAAAARIAAVLSG